MAGCPAREQRRDGAFTQLIPGRRIAKEVRHQLLHHLKHVGNVIVHIDPEDRVGEAHHKIVDHSHDGLPIHSH